MKYFNEYSKMIKERKLIEISLVVLFALQLIMIIIFNLFMLKNHMGYDSSWAYLKAALMWKEKSIISDIWVDQTNLFLDSSMPLASLIYGLTGNIFVSYGWSNIIVLVGILLTMSSILKKMGIEIACRYFAYNMVVCPYITNGYYLENDLGYFNNLLSGPNFYGLRALMVLLIVREFIVIRKEGRFDFWAVLGLVLSLIAGISSGIFVLVMIWFPYIIYEFEEAFLTNNVKIFKAKEAIFAYIGSVVVLLGNIVSRKILRIEAIDSSRTWTPISKIYINFGATIQGVMKLMRVLPVDSTDVSVMSLAGICMVFPIALFSICAIAIVISALRVKKNYKDNNGISLFFINIIIVNLIVFGLFNVQYGSAIFEERYLVSTFLIMALVCGCYLHSLNREMLFTKALFLCMFLCLLFDDLVSDTKYTITTNESWQMSDIKEIVESQKAELVYFWGDDVCVLGRSMRTYDLDHVYKEIGTEGGYHHWGDYLYYEDVADYNGVTLLVVPHDSSFVPNNIMDQYSIIKELDSVSIYRCDYNPIDQVAGITGPQSLDFPTSRGVVVQNGEFEGNDYITDGTSGFVMWGPFANTTDGIYDVSLEYDFLEGDRATFDVAIDYGVEQLGSVELNPENATGTIHHIVMEPGHIFEYRVNEDEGTKIKIKKIYMEKIQ